MRFTRLCEFLAFKEDRLFWLLRSADGKRPGGAAKVNGLLWTAVVPNRGWGREALETFSFQDG